MKLTKYTHSCVRLENQAKVLVIDPGGFSEVEEALEGADYLLITHAHPDHFQPQKVLAYLAEHPEVQVFAPQPVVDEILSQLPQASAQPCLGEEELDLPGFAVKTYGGQHALIHPLIPIIANVGYLINGKVYHPGDSLVVPHDLTPEVLLLPIHAPWNKIQEVIDFMLAVKAPRAYPIHNALLSDKGHTIIEGQLSNFGQKYGTQYSHLSAGQSLEI